jgi:hypothetical protein
LRAWLMLGMELAALFGKCRSSFVARRPNLDDLHSLRQLARAHQLLETFHHMQVTQVLSAPSDHISALRLLSGQGPGMLHRAPAAAHAAHLQCIKVWIIASFPVTTVPANCARRLPNTSWIPLHSTWCTSSVVSMSAAHLIKD